MLELPDGLAERLALLGVGERVLEGLLRDGQGGDADGDALARQVLHQGDESAALLAEQVRHGHPDVGEEQLGGVLGVHADLVQVPAAGEAGHAALDHEQADAPVPGTGVGARDHDHDVAQLAVRDERLLPVQQVMIPVAHGGGADALQVAAGPWLGHRDRGDELPGAVAGQPPFPLLRRAQAVEVGADHVVVQGEHGPVGAGPGQFLVQDRRSTGSRGRRRRRTSRRCGCRAGPPGLPPATRRGTRPCPAPIARDRA